MEARRLQFRGRAACARWVLSVLFAGPMSAATACVVEGRQDLDAGSSDGSGGDGSDGLGHPRFWVDGGFVDAGALEPDASDGEVGEVERIDGLPVLRLDAHPHLNRDGYTPAQIRFGGRRYRGPEAKYRGATSFAYPKKSFTLKFSEDDPLDDPETGFEGVRKVVLINSFDDNSYIRQALAFALWNRLQPHIEVRTAFVVLVFDGRYHGLYLMADHVSRHLMHEHGLWAGGNLYKARTHAADFRPVGADGPKSPHQGFTKEEGEPADGEPGAYADLDAFVRWLDEADDDALGTDLGRHIDIDDYGSWFILVTLIDALDSAGKNSYHYRDPRPDAPESVFRCVPWDFNASFGQGWQTERTGSTRRLSHFATLNEVFERLLSSPAFSPELLARYRTALDEDLSLAWVQGWLEETRAAIDAAARRDQALWGELYRSHFALRSEHTDYLAESAFVDRWIEARWAFIREELDAR